MHAACLIFRPVADNLYYLKLYVLIYVHGHLGRSDVFKHKPVLGWNLQTSHYRLLYIFQFV